MLTLREHVLGNSITTSAKRTVIEIIWNETKMWQTVKFVETKQILKKNTKNEYPGRSVGKKVANQIKVDANYQCPVKKSSN